MRESENDDSAAGRFDMTIRFERGAASEAAS
jgi:hypothetical protein